MQEEEEPEEEEEEEEEVFVETPRDIEVPKEDIAPVET